MGENLAFCVVPVEWLERLKRDIRTFREREELNGFQQWILEKRYILDPPDVDFQVRSLVVAASKYELRDAVYCWKGRRFRELCYIPRPDAVEELREAFSGYRLEAVRWFPKKRLAVCAGLAEYGRNNIVYREDWGSFFEIYTFLTDREPDADAQWREARHMAVCDSCGACASRCPTGAIRKDRFLMDNERCLPRLLELADTLPDWLPPGAYRNTHGCNWCQEFCRCNAARLREPREQVEFTAEETARLLEGVVEPVGELGNKLNYLGFEPWALKQLPGTLKALLENPGNELRE